MLINELISPPSDGSPWIQLVPLERWNDFDFVLASHKVSVEGRLHELREELVAQDCVGYFHDLESRGGGGN